MYYMAKWLEHSDVGFLFAFTFTFLYRNFMRLPCTNYVCSMPINHTYAVQTNKFMSYISCAFNPQVTAHEFQQIRKFPLPSGPPIKKLPTLDLQSDNVSYTSD